MSALVTAEVVRWPTLFLDLRSQVSSGGKRGLLGMAFAPGAVPPGRVFVNFTNPQGHTEMYVVSYSRGRILKIVP